MYTYAKPIKITRTDLRPKLWLQQPADPKLHKELVKARLKNLGVSHYALLRMEGRYLHRIIHPGERIEGIVYGKHESGFAMLLATDRRVIFLDKKPLFINEDEITYDIVGGVSLGHAGPGMKVTLHTRIKDYPIRTFNRKCAQNFIAFVEKRCLEHPMLEDLS